MLLDDEFLQRFELRLRRFEDDQHFRARLQVALPPVVRFDFGNQIGAGDEMRFKSRFGKRATCFYVRGSYECYEMCRNCFQMWVADSTIASSVE